jgi:hypothetical protein
MMWLTNDPSHDHILISSFRERKRSQIFNGDECGCLFLPFQFFDKVIDLCPNFRYMDTSSTFVWLFTNEHEQVSKKLGSFIKECFLLRWHNWSYRYHQVRWIIIVITHVILNMNWFMVVFDRLWSGRAVTEHKYVKYMYVFLKNSNKINYLFLCVCF